MKSSGKKGSLYIPVILQSNLKKHSMYLYIYINTCDANDCRQPNAEEEFEVPDLVNKLVRKTKDNIVNIEQELRAEECKCFCLFLCGINGLKETFRQVKIIP